MDAGGPFGLVPRPLWRDLLPPDAENRVPMAYHNLLVQTDDLNIIIDTGYGDRIPEKQRAFMQLDQSRGGLLGALARLNVQPHDVQWVINTHLHGDHCGGNVRLNEQNVLVPTFPNAQYVSGRREYEDAMRPNERTRATYSPEHYAPLVESGHMRLLDGDTEVLMGLHAVSTPGHTPGHMSIVLESGGESLMFLADLASFAVHFERLGWMTAYDVEPLVTLEQKRTWQKWALQTNALLIFPHDSVRPVGRYVLDERGKGVVIPLHEPYA